MRRFVGVLLATLVILAALCGLGAWRMNQIAPGFLGFGGGEKEADAPPPPDRDLLERWVQGGDLPSRYPGSPHRADSEEYAAFTACRRLLDTPAAATLRAAYTAALASEPTERRALAVGCLQDKGAIDLLVRQASSSDPKLFAGAVRALGFFGEAPRLERFIVYGGQFVGVEFPAAADPRATRALVEAFKSGAPDLRWKVLDALHAHRGAEVISVANAAAREPELATGAASLLEALACGDECRPALEAILAGSGTVARSVAARALAASRKPDAAEPLLRALAGSDEHVRKDVARQLWVLAGIPFPNDGADWSADPGQLQAAWRARFSGKPAPPELVEAAKEALTAGQKASEGKRCEEARGALLRAASLGAILDQASIAGAAAHGLGGLSDVCEHMFWDEEWYRFALGERRKAKDAAGIRDSASELGSTLFTRRAVPEAEAAYAETIAAAESLEDFKSAARSHAVMAVLWSKASEGEIHCAPNCGALSPRLDSDEERKAREHFAKLGEAARRAGLEKTACEMTRLKAERCAQLERKP